MGYICLSGVTRHAPLFNYRLNIVMENVSVEIEKGETLAHYAEKMSKMCKEGLIDVDDAIMIVCMNSYGEGIRTMLKHL